MTTLRTNYQEGEIFHASDINATNTEVNAKSVVSVSGTGTSTDEVSYITVNGIEKKLAGGGGGGGGIFIAEYDVTSWQDIVDAINANKAVFCKYTEEEEPPIYASLHSSNIENGECIFSAVIIVSADGEMTEYNSVSILVTLEDTETVWTNYATYGIIPTKTSQLTNDSNFAVLPNKVNDRYLHTNASTGALEWTQVSSSGGSVFVAEYGETTWQTINQHLNNGDMIYVSHSNGLLHGYVTSTSQAYLFTSTFGGENSSIYISTVYVTADNTWGELTNIEIPSTTNNRYLHTNASTGAFEWVEGTGGGEPAAYLKNASVNGNTLTLTKKDDSTVTFTPSGGGSNVFIATYDETTLADIITASDEGKAVLCSDYGVTCQLAEVTDEKATFYGDMVDSGELSVFELSVTEGGWDSNIVYTSSNDVFIAKYNETTYAEIQAAATAGKMLLCEHDSIPYNYVDGGGSYTFQALIIDSGYIVVITVAVTSANVWSTTSNTYPINSNYNATLDIDTMTGTSFAEIKTHYDAGQLPALTIVTEGSSIRASFVACNQSSAIFEYIVVTDSRVVGKSRLTVTASGWTKVDTVIEVPQLPTIENDKYLHTNASTGALEWVAGTGGGGTEQLFFVTPEVTTNAAINAAINSGKLPVFTSSNSGGMMIPVVSRSGNTIEFGNIYCNNEGIYSVHYTVDEDDVWTNDIVSIGLTGINFRAEFFGASSSDNTTYAQMLNAVDAQGKQPFLYDYTEGYECATLYTIGEDASEHVVFTFKNIHVTDNNVIENTYVLTYSGWTKTTTTKALLPAYTSADEGKILKIVDGTPTWTTA